MKKNDTLLNDTLKELDEYAKLIKESYVFNDGEEPMEDEFSEEEFEEPIEEPIEDEEEEEE